MLNGAAAYAHVLVHLLKSLRAYNEMSLIGGGRRVAWRAPIVGVKP